MNYDIVIIGAGHAGGQAVATLRHHGCRDSVLLVGEEPYPPYQRPPLSKRFLAGEVDWERLFLKPRSYYEEHDVVLRLGLRATGLSTREKRVTLSDGSEAHYHRLLLATGARARSPGIAGEHLAGVHRLRTIDDVLSIRTKLEATRRLVIIGAGYIGLEVAATAARKGVGVTVIELAGALMARTASPRIADFFLRRHLEAGVDFKLSTTVTELRGDNGHVRQVVTGAGEVLAADLVVVGAGALPSTELAEAAGIACDDGILVDEYARTSEADVYAAGDCTRHPNSIYGRRLRLESVHNAAEQAKCAALSLAGTPKAYQQVPWFWSDQYDLKLQIAGIRDGGEQSVLRGEPGQGGFSVLHIGGGRLLAAECVNQPRDFVQARKLIARPHRLDYARLSDPAVRLEEAVTVESDDERG